MSLSEHLPIPRIEPMCPFTHCSQAPDNPEKQTPYGEAMESPSDNLSLSPTDTKVLRVLWDSPGKVLSRETLVRKAGLDTSSARRVDSSMVVLRRVLGPDAVRTVRRRGWMLTEEGHQAAHRFLER